MVRDSFTHHLDTKKKDLHRWTYTDALHFPYDSLAECIIKMNVLCRLLYPQQMIHLLISSNIQKLVNDWLFKIKESLKIQEFQPCLCSPKSV